MGGDCRSSIAAYLPLCGKIKHLCDRNCFALVSGTKSAIEASSASLSSYGFAFFNSWRVIVLLTSQNSTASSSLKWTPCDSCLLGWM
jgi:hypothetical protein